MARKNIRKMQRDRTKLQKVCNTYLESKVGGHTGIGGQEGRVAKMAIVYTKGVQHA